MLAVDGLLLGVLVVAAAAVLLVLVLRPRVAAAVLIITVVSSVSSVVGEVGPVGLYVVSLAIALLALLVALRRGVLAPVWSPVLLFALLYLAVRALSLVWARDPGVAAGVVLAEAADLALLFVLAPLLAALPGLRAMVAAAVGVVALLAGLTLVQEFLLDNSTTFGGFSNVPLGPDVGSQSSRHSGPEGDANFWGRTLVLFLPLALALAVGAARRSLRIVCVVLALVILGGEYLTSSRGGMLAAAAAVAVWLLLSGLPRRYQVLLVAVGCAVVVLVPGVATRLGTLTQTSPGIPSRSDPSLVSRSEVQRVGLAMFQDYPFVGVGAGNFEVVQPEYRRRYGPQLTEVLAPHNLYLQMLVEGGILLLLCWLLFFGSACFVAARAYVVARRLAAESPQRLSSGGKLAASTLAALVGWALASVVLHLANLRTLLVVVAFGVALDVRARRAAATYVPTRISARPRPRRYYAWATPLSVACSLAAVGVAARTTLAAETTWTASTSAIVVPAPAAEGSSYVVDVLSRQSILPTFAALAAHPHTLAQAARAAGVESDQLQRATLSVTLPAQTDVIEIGVTSPSRSEAELLAPASREFLQRYVDSLASVYVVRPASNDLLVVLDTPVRPLLPGLALSAGLLLVGLGGTLRSFGSAAPRRPGRGGTDPNLQDRGRGRRALVVLGWACAGAAGGLGYGVLAGTSLALAAGLGEILGLALGLLVASSRSRRLPWAARARALSTSLPTPPADAQALPVLVLPYDEASRDRFEKLVRDDLVPELPTPSVIALCSADPAAPSAAAPLSWALARLGLRVVVLDARASVQHDGEGPAVATRLAGGVERLRARADCLLIDGPDSTSVTGGSLLDQVDGLLLIGRRTTSPAALSAAVRELEETGHDVVAVLLQ